MSENQTDFGFERVSFQEKTERVKNLFTQVAGHYDLMNDAMSFGLHRPWKKSFVHRLPLKPNMTILDVAGGTGDIALLLMKLYRHLQLKILNFDLTFSMIEEGRDKALNQGLLQGLTWYCGNAEALPFERSCIDLYTVAFGMRNIAGREKSLKEAWRVLKPGGWFYCLEFSRVENPLLSKVYELYSFKCLPTFGRWIADNEAAYRYLVESIQNFPSQKEWQQQIEQAGFSKVTFENFAGGIVALHCAQKIN